MKLKKFIKKIINESNSYPFNLDIQKKELNGFKYNIFYYNFNIDGFEYECVIYPNIFRIKTKDYDVDFITKGEDTKYIVGKDLKFMNSVLKTVSDCIIDFIDKNDLVKNIRFQSQGIREKAYVRFFKQHPYFSKFQIDDTYENSGFVEIHINKGID